MAIDVETLHAVDAQDASPTLRFFRWSEPTASFGRLQNPAPLARWIPAGWPTVRRPTGGGLVLHDQDLCFSLCWRRGQAPLPTHLQDYYAWIHRVIYEALSPLRSLTMASCDDCRAPGLPFLEKRCFSEPVAYDLLDHGQKIVGGALCRSRQSFLYQGSIQAVPVLDLESRLIQAFAARFTAKPQ